MRSHYRSSTMFVIAAVAAAATPLAAQVRTSQAAVINIGREFEKPGHFGMHEAVEKRWAALNRQYGYPITYTALSAVSGQAEVWYVSAYDGIAAWGKSGVWGSDNPAYMAALSKIAAEDGEHLSGFSSMQAAAVPAASYGAYPDMSKVRVYSVLTVTMRQGMENAFTGIAQQYAAIIKAKGVETGWRSYQVISGAPAGTYLVFTSYPSWDAVEAIRKATDAAMMSAAPADMEAMGKSMRDAVASSTTRFFTVNPTQSLAPKEWASDPFWGVKP